ncbi:methyltransferase domain-containing protein [Nonomuraea maritima]|uniref:methyltransferase domain-containing protein n=1 Tax=Nonomuraea maritima TaxID=683260 RepID=UPI003712A379
MLSLSDLPEDTPDEIRSAIRAVPRHQFIPVVALVTPPDTAPRLIDRDADPRAWWDAVYSNMPVITQLNDGATPVRDLIGRCTSSASAPSTIADMLTRLNPAPGHRVLEIGTGTGWTSALLCHLVGGRGQVTSIEIDQSIAEQAAKNLAGAGAPVTLVVGDGALGWPPGEPYDRVHVTCGVRTVPYAWVEQCRPGGVIALPYCPDFGGGHSLKLVVRPDGVAVGRFLGHASYTMSRPQRPRPTLEARGPHEQRSATTRVDPRTIAYAPPGADLAISALTGLVSNFSAETDEDGDCFRLWISDPTDSYSWAGVLWRPNRKDYEVYQVGDRPVWDEVLDAYSRWVGWGQPGRDRFGMTLTPHHQHIWLDSPDHPLP